MRSKEQVQAALSWLTNPVVPDRFAYLGNFRWSGPEGSHLEWSRPGCSSSVHWEDVVAFCRLLRDLRRATANRQDNISAWLLRRVLFTLYETRSSPQLSDIDMLLNLSTWLGVNWTRSAPDGVYDTYEIRFRPGSALKVQPIGKLEVRLILVGLGDVLQRSPIDPSDRSALAERVRLLDAMGELAEEFDSHVYGPFDQPLPF